MTRIATLIAALAFLAATTATAAEIPQCKGSQLAGTFKVVPGSAGAGNIVYALRLKNVSSSSCSVTGLPFGRLLGKTGKALPTHVQPAFRPGLTAILVRLAPGQVTKATARFSPDVPGPGEPAAGKQCEPTAYAFRVTLDGGGTTTAKLAPATPVCEHGTMQFSAYGRG